jgi:hypothetical protein
MQEPVQRGASRLGIHSPERLRDKGAGGRKTRGGGRKKGRDVVVPPREGLRARSPGAVHEAEDGMGASYRRGPVSPLQEGEEETAYGRALSGMVSGRRIHVII